MIALLADPPSAGDARHFAFVIGLLEVGVGPVVAMMSAGSGQLVRGRVLHRLTVRRSALHAIEGSIVPWVHAADLALLQGPRTPASCAAARRALGAGLALVGPHWLARDHPDLAGTRVFTTDGRARSLLPALLRAMPSGRV